MAGSKRYFKYISDTNENYSVFIDESNAEVNFNSGQLMPNRDSAYPTLPRGYRMRYILAESIGVRKIQRKFYVGDPILLVGAGTSLIITAPPYPDSLPVDWVVTCYRGEKRNFIPPVSTTDGDNGLNDGDPGRDEVSV
jgi:hypothetical protein